VRIALHEQRAGEAEKVEQRDVFLCRRAGRRVAAAGRVGKLLRRPEDVGVAVPGAGRQRDTRLARLRDGSGDARWIGGYVAHTRRKRAQPSLMLASLTTRLHFSISAATKARNSSGVFWRNSTLKVVRRSITSGFLSVALSPLLSVRTISSGVPVGTNTPFHS